MVVCMCVCVCPLACFSPAYAPLIHAAPQKATAGGLGEVKAVRGPAGDREATNPTTEPHAGSRRRNGRCLTCPTKVMGRCSCTCKSLVLFWVSNVKLDGVGPMCLDDTPLWRFGGAPCGYGCLLASSSLAPLLQLQGLRVQIHVVIATSTSTGTSSPTGA